MSEKDDIIGNKVGRRGFLKGSLATGASGLTVGVGGFATCAAQAVAAETAERQKGTPAKKCWETPPRPIGDWEISRTIDVDIVVVGAGIGGLAVSLAAAEKGAKIALIEKTPSYAARGFANGAIGTKIHKKLGVELDKEQIVGELISWASNRIHQRLIRLWADRSGEILDYYIDLAAANGLDATLMPSTYQVSPLYKEYRTAIQFHKPDRPQDIFTEDLLLGTIEKKVRELGVDVHYSTPARQLVREGVDGHVSAVIAESKGEYIKFTAKKGIVLASGDYGANREMLAAWSPLAAKADKSVYFPVGANTGDGINMAMWIGGTIADLPHPPMIHIIPFVGTDFMSANQSFLHINRNGLRYENEGQPLQGVIDGKLMQPEGKVWGVFDSKYGSDLDRFKGEMFGPINEPLPALEDSIRKGLAFRGDTIEALAKEIGVPPSALKTTVSRYTALAKKGVDEDYGKDRSLLFTIEKPPFYAVTIPAHLLVIVGGLNVNDRQAVVDRNDKEIPGLFAVGNVAGNLFANDYPLTVPGLSHGRCLVLGRILGQELAAKS